MRIKNESPFQVATVVAARKPPQPEAVVVVKGTFRLVHGGAVEALSKPDELLILTGDRFTEGDEQSALACTYPSDFAETKLNAEVLLIGSAYSPQRKPVSELPVKLEVGSWAKSLRVIGQRAWSSGLVKSFSDAAPFTEMPLSYENAFGGADFDANPAGKGLTGSALPTVELAGDVLRSRSDRPAPASFGPISPFWRARSKKLGKEYGAAWRRGRAPYRSVDFDWSYFHAAPADQQYPGYLRGDETLTLQNLHPEVPILRTRLPGKRVRVFVQDDQGAQREVPMVLDTLLVESNRGVVALTWRGLTNVREDDRDDLKFLLVVTEPLADKKVPDAVYLAMLTAFADDPIGLKEGVPEELRAAFFGGDAGDAPDEHPVVALLEKKLGKSFERKSELKAALDKATAAGPELMNQVVSRLRDAEAKAADTPPIPSTNKPGHFPELHLRRKMREVMAQADKLRKAMAEHKVPDELKKRIAELDQIPHHPKWRRIDPEYTPPLEPISSEQPAPKANLAEQDLTGRDLSGIDLSGADLTQAILTRASLKGANLTGAKLRGATLFKTDLSGANLTDADLTRANAAQANLEGALLERAIVDHTFFQQAKLSRASFSRAKGEYAMFIKADVEGADFRDASLPYADWSEAGGASVVLRGAKLARAALNGAVLPGADFTDANISRAGLRGANLAGARLVGISAERCVLDEATLDGADASFGSFVGAHFTRCSARAAVFVGANLRDARLTRANLSEARFERANLMGAELGKARVDGASFRNASLYDAKLLGTSGRDADFVGAVLHNSTLERS